jgi:hypothetical protein
VSSAYERLNLAQSVASGPHGKLVRLVSRIAMLTLEVPAAMRSNDWPEQRRIRGDLDEALARLRDARTPDLPSLDGKLAELTRAGEGTIASILKTPRGSVAALEEARAASSQAVQLAESITALLNESGAGSQPLVDS